MRTNLPLLGKNQHLQTCSSPKCFLHSQYFKRSNRYTPVGVVHQKIPMKSINTRKHIPCWVHPWKKKTCLTSKPLSSYFDVAGISIPKNVSSPTIKRVRYCFLVRLDFNKLPTKTPCLDLHLNLNQQMDPWNRRWHLSYARCLRFHLRLIQYSMHRNKRFGEEFQGFLVFQN